MPRLIVHGFTISLDGYGADLADRSHGIQSVLPWRSPISGCAGPSADDCWKILDLEMRSHDEPGNKILNYYKSHPFVETKDTAELLRFEEPRRIGYFFQASEVDPTKRKFTYSVIEGLIRTSTYQWDLLALVDEDLGSENIKYWLKSYDGDRKQVGHLDFAYWSSDGFGAGRIDCDSTLHLILNERNEHRVFSIDENGVNHLVETKKFAD
ncbi:MAG: hypothetical protein IPP33_13440 [Flavobacteriales bacterium]|nr:hypothetical protein [Flavobacteriales bacterium]